MKRNNYGSSSKSQIQNNSWWNTTLLVWLLWLMSSQRATRPASPSLSHYLFLLSFNIFLNEANSQVLQKPFPAIFDLSKLDGSNGIRFDGVVGELSGRSVASAGDFNGDGIDDVIIGAITNFQGPGSSYVVFGRKSAFPSQLSLSSLNGANGVKLVSAAGDSAGSSVSYAGDFNGDGIDDVIIGAPRTGASYVVFGSRSTFSSVLMLSSLDGKIGVRIDGAVGAVSSAGDFNGDGIDDVLIGTSGAGYVVFGHKGAFPSVLSLSSLNGVNGVKLVGGGVTYPVSDAGDFNDDGINDVILGAHQTDASGLIQAGISYVVFGRKTSFPSELLLSSLNGSNGVRIEGGVALGYSGSSVSRAGDFNVDGIDDVIICAYGSAASYVVFGRKSVFPSVLSLSSLDGSNGLQLNGFTTDTDKMGSSVSFAGDVNGDGIDDVMIADYTATPNSQRQAGISFVVFGRKSAFPSILSLSALDGGNGGRLEGVAWNEHSGGSIAHAGDFNGDGIDDVIIGASAASPNNQSYAGSTYVVFGSNATRKITVEQNRLILEKPGIRKILTDFDLQIRYETASPELLDVTITEAARGQFQLINVSQTPPFTFKQSSIPDGALAFLHDGGDSEPSYNVKVSDWRTTVGPVSVMSMLLNHNLIELTQDEILTLNTSMLQLKMTSRTPQMLRYQVVNSTQLIFSQATTGVKVMSFTQADIDANKVAIETNLASLRNPGEYPHFEFEVYDPTNLAYPRPIKTNLAFYLKPIITTNTLSILTPGELVTVGPDQLTVNHGQDPGDDLDITIDKVVGGTFSLNNITQSPPFQFKARVIRQNALSFTQDGTDTLPSYEVSVTDGRRIAGPKRASVTAAFAKQLPPQIINNQLSLNEGERKLLTRNNLLAEDDAVTNPALIRYLLIRASFIHIKFNQLLLNRTNIEEFNQKEINDAAIEVVHDGEDAAPSASFQVSDGELTGMTTSFNITFHANQDDAPVLKLNEVLIKQGEVIAVTTDWLTASDSDAGDTEKLIIKVISSTHGYFRKVGEDVALIEFTRADVIANHIEFVHDGSSAAPEIKLQASDGMLTSDEQTLAVKFAEAGNNNNGAAIGIGTAIGILSCAGLFAGGYAFYRKRQADLSRAGNELDVRVSRIVYERLNIKGVSNFQSGPGLKYVAQITEINQAYQRVNGEISDVRSYSEALAQAIKAVFSADADVISKGNWLSFNIADENKRQPLRRQCEAIVERCRNSVSDGNRELTTNNGKDIPLKTF